MKKYKKTILKILISVTLFGIIFARYDMTLVFSQLREIMDKNIEYIPIVLLLLLLNYLLSAVRWKSLLIFEGAKKINIKYLFNLYLIGTFFNNFMPTSIGGDVYKFITLGKKIGSKSNAFAATFMERVTGLVALAVIAYFGFIASFDVFVETLSLQKYSIFQNKILTEVLLLALFVIGMVLGLYAFKLFSSKIKILKTVYDSFMVYKSKRNVLLYAFLTSFLVQFIAVATQYCIFLALGVHVPLDFALFVLPVITIASFVIPSINGIGVQDLMYAKFFLTVGVPEEIALSVSIIYHLSRLFVSLLGGLLYVTEKDS